MSLPKYVTAEQLSAEIESSHGFSLSPARLAELAKAGHIPYSRIDGKGPYFQADKAKRWIKRNLVVDREARPFPTELTVADFASRKITRPAPTPLAMMSGDLVEYPMESLEPAPCVYFLVRGDRIIYVGMTTRLAHRLSRHRARLRRLGEASRFDRVVYLPVPREAAPSLELAFIRIIRPELNGGQISEPGEADRAVVRRMYGPVRSGEV